MTASSNDNGDTLNAQLNAVSQECKALLKAHHANGVPTESILTAMGLCAARFMVALHGPEAGDKLISMLQENLRDSPIDRVDSL